jgi:hypothetical protein
MWIWVALIVFVMIGVMYFMRTEQFYVENSVISGVKTIKITNNNPTPFERYIQISQLAAYDAVGNNVAKNQATASSGVWSGSSDRYPVDGTLQARGFPYIYHSTGASGNDFWQVTLANPTDLTRIDYYNRADCCYERALSYMLTLYGAQGQSLAVIPFAATSPMISIYLNKLNGANAKGDKGDQGPQGPAGPQGAAGAVAAKGDRGEKGDTGPKGDTGLQGLQGQPGLAGAPGSNGAQGIAGSIGPTGALGPTGAQGEKGLQGDQGSIGPPGKDALTDGPSGYQTTSLGSSKLPLLKNEI